MGAIGTWPHTYIYATTYEPIIRVTDQAGLTGEINLLIEGYYLAPSYVRSMPTPRPNTVGLAYANGSLWAIIARSG